jgi:NADP-reducing hydrogenase subunit HndB
MARLTSVEDLHRWREEAANATKAQAGTGTTIFVGMGTCGIAAGAREVMHSITEELEKRGIRAEIISVGCIGQCVKEPLVDIRQAGAPRVTYANVRPEMVPRLIEEHLLNGRIPKEWALGVLEADWT